MGKGREMQVYKYLSSINVKQRFALVYGGINRKDVEETQALCYTPEELCQWNQFQRHWVL